MNYMNNQTNFLKVEQYFKNFNCKIFIHLNFQKQNCFSVTFLYEQTKKYMQQSVMPTNIL